MSCSRYRQLLSRYVDGEVTPRQRGELLSHVQNCPECAAWLARARQTDTLLKRLPPIGPSDRVRSAVLGLAVPADSRRAGRQQSHKPAAGVGGLRLGAAGLLLRFDPTPRRIALATAASLVAVLGMALWLNVVPPLWGYDKLGFELQPDEGRAAYAATPMPAISSGINGVGGPVAVPNLVRLLPPRGADQVDLGTSLQVRFDQPMDRASVQDAFDVEPPLAGTFRWTADNDLSFEPAEPGLLRGVTYTVHIGLGARSLAGTPMGKPIEWLFHTRDPHLVTAALPTGKPVPLTATFGLTFDAPVDQAGMDGKIGLYAQSTGEKLPVLLNWSADGRKLSVAPQQPLSEGGYSLRVDASGVTAEGDTLGRAYEFAYTAAMPPPWVRLGRMRVRTMEENSTLNVDYRAVADNAGTPAGRILFSVYRLPTEQLGQLVALTPASLVPAPLPEGFLAGLERTKTFRPRSPEGMGYEEEQGPVEIAGLPSGLYLLRAEAIVGGATASDWQILAVESARLAFVPGETASLVWATDRAGHALGNAQVSLYAADGSLLEQGVTDEDGLWQPTKALRGGLAMAQDDAGHLAVALLDPAANRASAPTAFMPTESGTLAASLLTDLPRYAPGQVINFRALIGAPRQAAPATPSTELNVTIRLLTPEGAALSSLLLRPDSVGGVGGLFPLSPYARPGVYTLQVAADKLQRSFPVSIVAPEQDTLSVLILPARGDTASDALTITRTVSVLGDGGAPAVGAAITATLLIEGDAWASEPVTATTGPDGRASFSVPAPDWADHYSDPSLAIAVQAGAGDKSGSDRQYLYLAPDDAPQAGLPQMFSPGLGLTAVAHTRRNGSIAVRLVQFGDTDGDLLVSTQAPTGGMHTEVIALSAAGDVTVTLAPGFAGGKVLFVRAGVEGRRELSLMPARSSDTSLRIVGPSVASPGENMPITLSLTDAEEQGLGGKAVVRLRRVQEDGTPQTALDWVPNVDIQASGVTTTTLRAPLSPGLWYIMAQAATPEGAGDLAWTTLRVEPGPILQLPPLEAPHQTGRSLSSAVVLHNPTQKAVVANVVASGQNGLAVLGNESQGAYVDAGGWQKFDWQYKADRPGWSSLLFNTTFGPDRLGIWTLPQAFEKNSGNATATYYASGLLTGERSIAVNVPSGLREDGVQLQVRASTSLAAALADIAEEMPAAPDKADSGVALAAARLCSASIAASAFSRAGGTSPLSLEQTGTTRALLLMEIYSAQHADGGWGAELAGDLSAPADLGTTAHVLAAMRRLSLASAGEGEAQGIAPVDAAVVGRGLGYLTGELARPIPANASTEALDARAYGMYALSLYGLLKEAEARPLLAYAVPGKQGVLSSAGQAWLGVALIRAGSTEDALWTAVRLGAQPDLEVESLAPMLELVILAEAAPTGGASTGGNAWGKLGTGGMEAEGRYAEQLMSSRKGLGWDGPAATQDALWALSLYAAQEGAPHGGAPTVTLNGVPVRNATMHAEGHGSLYVEETGSLSVRLSGEVLHPGTNQLRLVSPKTGEGLYYSLTLEAER